MRDEDDFHNERRELEAAIVDRDARLPPLEELGRAQQPDHLDEAQRARR